MKIRILNNSLRLRLSQSEVDQLISTGIVKSSIKFSENIVLGYALMATVESPKIQAFYDENEIGVSIPLELAESWANTDQVGLSEEIIINTLESLKILIEKDFKCLSTNRQEDESDLFPHPKEEVC